MEKKPGSLENRSRVILSLYVLVCSILALIILLAPFQNANTGTVRGEIYLRSTTSQSK